MEVLFVEESRPGEWEVMMKSSRRPALGNRVALADGSFEVEVLSYLPNGRVCVKLPDGRPLLDVLEKYGVPPVPPYIKRAAGQGALTRLDRERYQTVFATHPGAVAAPTAGLHFTDELLAELGGKGVKRSFVTLHVGPGTFRPVKSEFVGEHVMDPERYVVPDATAVAVAAAKARGGRVLAVGSTSVRTLETSARECAVGQGSSGRSALFIYPPFVFRSVDMILTNFHLPKSTLLMMMSAFASRQDASGDLSGIDLMKRAYGEAVGMKYRFFSYGDCMLIV